MNKKILIIDDDLTSCILMKEIIYTISSDLKVDYVLEPFDDVRKYDQYSYVFIDDMMPGRNGYEILLEIKAKYPAKYVAIVTMTDELAVDKKIADTADSFVYKSQLSSLAKKLIKIIEEK